MKRPAVVVVTRRTARKNLFINYVGELHLNLLVRLKLLPLMVPVVAGAEDCVAQYAEQIGEGRTIAPIEVHTGDEFETLANAFNKMTARLDASMRRIQEIFDQKAAAASRR